MAALAQPHFSPEEYLALERKAETRSEYLNGVIYAMSGASRRHNRIVFNIAGSLSLQLRDRPCEAYINKMRVKIDPTGAYVYPDVVGLCGDAQFEDAELDTLLNPQVIIEVLSDSKEAYNRGAKFAHYRRLFSLTDYLLISQHQRCVEHYTRQEDRWVLEELNEMNDMVEIASLGCRLTLEEIYHKVDLQEGG